MSANVPVKVPQPSVPAPAKSLPTPSSELSSAIVLPFQILATTFGSVETAFQISLSSHPSLQKLMAPYRHVQLVECEAVFCPNSFAVSAPITINAVWTTANSPASPVDILQIYGGRPFTFGGSLQSTSESILPLPGNFTNAMLKDSVAYLDTPKLLAYSPVPSSPSKLPSVHLLIRGKLRLSSPLLLASPSS
ncbi:coat protein [Chayote mosaic virus]|uniref:Capsid protein n=1 Tax=Chayote mosaic virus TaxID=71030 RepID=Q9QCX2_9VIRU|nr:coat protein [Chayote mosaic virus]AAF09241.1 virion protein [Chayote mosaic virus]